MILAILFPVLTVAIKYTAYTLLPTSVWLNYQSIAVTDVKSGDTTQQWVITRDVKHASIRGTYIHDALCDGNSPIFSEVFTRSGDVLYQKGTTTAITSPIPNFPPGQCFWISNVQIELPYGIVRDLPEDIKSNVFLVK